MAGIQLGLIGSFPTPVTSSFESIATVSGNGSAQELTFSSIPSTYQYLQIRGLVRNARNNGSFPFGNLSIYFNGTEGSNADHYLRGNGSTATAAGNTGITALTIGSSATDAQTSNVMTAFIIDIHNYTSTTQNKTVRSFIGTDVNGTGRVELSSALSLSTSAVSSITIANYNGAAFTSASVFSLYGIKGA